MQTLPTKIEKRLTDEALAYFELRNDTFFHKIPKEKVYYYISNSLLAGKRAAKEYPGNINAVCEREGISIQIHRSKGIFPGISMRAQSIYSRQEKIIRLYSESINEFLSGCENTNLPDGCLDYERIIALHIAHEFFHYIEYKEEKSVPNSLEPVITKKIGKVFTQTAHIHPCSEIAAHKFCKCINGLRYLPNIYDLIFLLNNGRMNNEFMIFILDEFESIKRGVNK